MIKTKIDESEGLKDFLSANGVKINKEYEQILSKIAKSHSEIRKILGGPTVDLTITIPQGISGPLEQNGHIYILEDIAHDCKDYFNEYKLTPQNLLDDYVVVNGRRFRTAKHFLNWLDNSIYRPYIKNGFEQMIKEVRNNKTTKETLTLTISTLLVNFLKLGNYGCDDQSCFAIDDFNASCATNLANTQNSFVVFAPDKTCGTLAEWRCFGVYVHKKQMVLIRNLYPCDVTANPYIAIKTAFETLFKQELKPFKLNNNNETAHDQFEDYAFDVPANEFPTWDFSLKV